MTDPRLSFDLIVLGSGPAGEKGAAQVAYFGKRVALVEQASALGGAAANTGTLPSKTLRETALMLSGFKARGTYGVDLSLRREATVRDFLARQRQVTDTERERIARNLERHKIARFQGAGSFVDPHTIRVDPGGSPPVLLEAPVILIATGSRPHRPSVFPFHHPRIYDSDTILNLHQLPKKLAVVGAGVIGSEYACTFAALGVEVTLIDGRAELLPFLDEELSQLLMRRMEQLGIRFHMPGRVLGCTAEDATVKLELDAWQPIVADAVLVASGRSGNTESLNLPAAGIVPGQRGLLEVDAWYRTRVPHICAAGDVVGFPALASTSMEQARLAMVQAFELEYKKELAPILPYGIYTIPEVSMAGATEQELTKGGIDFVVGRASYGQHARGQIIGDEQGLLKLLFRREDMQLAGVHVIGEIASELVHVGLTALLVGAGAELFIRTCYNYPTLGELYKYATYDAMGQR